MTDDSPEIFLPGSRSLHEDQPLFADIKAANWLDERNRWCNDGQDFQIVKSGSNLLDDIRAADAVNAIGARSDEPDEQPDQMALRADPIVLTWVKGFGWVRSGVPVVAQLNAMKVAHPTELPTPLSDRT